MGILRRDIATQWISRVLQQPALIEASSLTALTGDTEHKLSIALCPPQSDELTSRIDNLSTVLMFLNQHLFPHLPTSAGFPLSLGKPVTTAVLNELLVPSLPSSASGLPTFLELLNLAVKFEEDCIAGMLGGNNMDKDIKRWADAVAAHYERKRRVDILEETRLLVFRPEEAISSFRVAVALPSLAEPPKPDVTPPPERVSSPEDAAWGLDEDTLDTTVDEEGWGLDDEVIQPESPSQAETAIEPEPDRGVEEDDAWAWNDGDVQAVPVNGEEDSSDSSAWDDPWGEPAPQISSPSKPKTASRLEKLSNKGKFIKDASTLQSPVPVPPPPPTPAMGSSVQPKTAPVQPRVEREFYLVSGRVKELATLVEHVLEEAAELAVSPVLAPYAAAASSTIGNTLYQASTQALDLYRALYPVTASTALSGSVKRSACFSNDCLWMNEEVAQMASNPSIPASTRDRLRECGDIFKLLSNSWYDDTLVRICVSVYSHFICVI